MKKKISLIVLTLVMALCVVFGVTACGGDDEACSHNIVTEQAVSATCVLDGKTEKKYCSKCGEVVQASTVIPATGNHAYTEWKEAKPASCTEAGYSAHFACLTCDTKFDANKNVISGGVEISKLSHEFGTLVSEVPATCTEAGIKAHKQCSLCQKAYDEQGNLITNVIINAKGHTLGEWVPVTPATCGSEGSVAHYTCSVCEKNYKSDGLTEISAEEFVIPAKSHTYSTTYSKDATEHWLEATCGHNETVVKEAHVFNEGVCICGYAEPVTGHVCSNGTFVPAKDATCAKAGNVEYYACECGLNYSDEAMTQILGGVLIPTTAHDLDFVPAVPATCIANGSMAYYKCADCQNVFDENMEVFTGSLVVLKTNHSLGDLIEGTPATCVNAGTKEHYVCETCGKFFADVLATFEISDIVSPATGKHIIITNVTSEATCTANGEKKLTCATCNYEKTEIINLLGHSWNVEEATCTQIQECTREGCNAQNSKSHDFDVVTTPATCESAETTVYTCFDCKYSYTEIGEQATGHSVLEWVEGLSVPLANCQKAVSYAGNCENCQTVQTKIETVDSHNVVAQITTDATCQEAGIKSYICTACSTVVKTEAFEDANAHNFGAGTKEGNVVTFTCANGCGTTKTELDYSSATTTDVLNASDLEDKAVKLENASIVLDSATLSQITEGATLSAGVLDDTTRADAISGLSEEDKELLGDSEIYEFTMTNGSTPVTQFDGYVTVTIPYKLGTDEDADSIVIWYINGDTPEAIDDVIYTKVGDEETVTFRTNHFSRYTVSKLTPTEACERFGCLASERQVEATCTTEGYIVNTCGRCGIVTRYDFVSARGHSLEVTEEVPATCEEAGKRVIKCEDCDYTFTNVIPASGHAWKQNTTLTVFSTCTTSGVAVFECEVEGCDATYRKSLPVKEHNYRAEVTLPTCLEGGYTTYTCQECERASYVDNVVPAKGHSYVLNIENPTCTEDGSKIYTCECGDVKTEKIDKLGHTWNIETPTCGQGQTCLICEAQGASATGAHNMVAGKCSVCGEGCTHAYENEGAIKEIAPTCTANGYTESTCDICGIKTVGKHTKATGHKGDMVCTVCGHKIASERFFINAINSLRNNKFAIKITDVIISSTGGVSGGENISIKGAPQEDSINIEIKFAELSIGFDDRGELFGYGSGTFNYNNGKNDSSMFAIIENGKMYAFGTDVFDSSSEWNSFNKEGWFREEYMSFDGYAVTSLDSLALQAGEQSVMLSAIINKIPEIVSWFRQEIKPLVDNAIALNEDSLNGIVASVFERIFKMESTTDGYALSLSAEKMMAFVNDLCEKPLKEVFFGGSDERVQEFAETLAELGETTLGTLLTKYEQKGISIKVLLDALNKLAVLITDGQLTTVEELIAGMTGGDMFEGATIEQMIDSMRPMTVNELVNMMMQAPEGQEVTFEMIAMMLVGSDEQPGMLEMNLVQLAEGFGGMTIDANMLGQIEGYLAILDTGFKFVISTDTTGAITKIQTLENIEMEGTTVKVNLEFVPNYQLIGNYSEAIRKVEELCSKLEITTSNVDKFAVEIEKEIHGYNQHEYYAIKKLNGEYEVSADDEGNVQSITFTRVVTFSTEKADLTNPDVKTVSNAMMITTVAYLQHPMISSTTDCLNWHEVSMNVYVERTTVIASVQYTVGQDGRITIVEFTPLMDSETGDMFYEEETEMESAIFRLNPETGAIAPYRYHETAHNFALSKKAIVTDECNAVYEDEYLCLNCGMIKVVRYCYGHTAETYIFDFENKGEHVSCEEGVTVTKKCTACDTILFTETINDHRTYPIVAKDVENKNACDYHKYMISACACGENVYASFLQRTYHENGYGEGFNQSYLNNGVIMNACPECGLYAISSNLHEESTDNTCNTRNIVSASVGFVGGSLIYSLDKTYKIKSHWFTEAEVSLQNSFTSCNDGINVKETCGRCGFVVEKEEFYHRQGIVKKIALSEFGLTNGGYLNILGCACGDESYYEDVRISGNYYARYETNLIVIDDNFAIQWTTSKNPQADSCTVEMVYEFTYGTWDGSSIVNGETRADGVWGGFEHDYILEETSDPCWKEQVCSVCGHEGGSIETHEKSTFTVQEATCVQMGVVREYCHNCDWYERTYTVPALGHEFIEDYVTGGYRCTLCGLESDVNDSSIVFENVTEPGVFDTFKIAVSENKEGKYDTQFSVGYIYEDEFIHVTDVYPEYLPLIEGGAFSHYNAPYILINTSDVVSAGAEAGHVVNEIVLICRYSDWSGEGQYVESITLSLMG